jgi:hypothetical protein
MRKTNKATLKHFTLFIILGFMLAATGCATRMALEKNKTTLDTSKESIALMTIRTSNQVKQEYQLPLSYTYVKTGEGKKAKQFITPRSFNDFENESYEYFISLALPPGKSTIWLIEGILQLGGFEIEPNISFNLEPDSIVYVGHLEMVNRIKREGEKQPARFKSHNSGLLMLYLEYATYQQTGFRDGTMELTVSDRFDEDMKKFKQRYPILENFTVKKGIMKPKEEENKVQTP